MGGLAGSLGKLGGAMRFGGLWGGDLVGGLLGGEDENWDVGNPVINDRPDSLPGGPIETRTLPRVEENVPQPPPRPNFSRDALFLEAEALKQAEAQAEVARRAAQAGYGQRLMRGSGMSIPAYPPMWGGT
jgi:hypothetical protein